MGDGSFPVLPHGEYARSAGDPRDRRVDRAAFGLRRSCADGQVRALEAARVHLALQTVLHMRVLREHHEAGGGAIEPLHRARGSRRARAFQVMRDEIAQRSAFVARSGVNDEAGGLIDDKEVLVLVDDGERTRFRLDGVAWFRGRVVDDDAHDLAASHDLVGLAANAFKHDAVFDDLRASNRRVADEHGAPQHRKHGFAVEGRSHRMG